MAKKAAKKVVKKAVKKAVKKVAKKVPVKKVSGTVVTKDDNDPPEPRAVLYPEVSVAICQGESALTEEKAKELLGCEETDDKGKSSDGSVFTDLEGKRYRCWNNDRNRPFYNSTEETLAQEILRRRMKFNGETLIIGKTGLNLSCQHRLRALIRACQLWRKNPDAYPEWTTQPVLETIVVFGIEEDDETVNTIDTGRPRSLADVLYRSELFAGSTSSERRVLAKATDYGIRTLWERTGVSKQPWAPLRTHSESLDFIARHPRLLEAVKHLHEEDGGGDGKVSKFLSPGHASGLLYLMAAARSDRSAYLVSGGDPHEANLDMSLWDKAIEFWTLIAGQDKSMAGLRASLGSLLERNLATTDARRGILVNAWNLFIADETITQDAIDLEWTQNDDGVYVLTTCPTIGGVDVGNASQDDEELSQDEVEANKERVKAESQAKKTAGGKAAASTTEPSTGKTHVQSHRVSAADIGGNVWVVDEETPEASWSGTLQDIFDGKDGVKMAKVKVGKGFASAGKVFDAPLATLSTQRPSV